MKIQTFATVLVIALAGKTAVAQQMEWGQKTVLPGVYYAFSRPLADRLALNYDQILGIADLQEGEHLAVRVEENNEIDITIFDDTQFAAARLDFILL